jgi:hypothetical protein
MQKFIAQKMVPNQKNAKLGLTADTELSASFHILQLQPVSPLNNQNNPRRQLANATFTSYELSKSRGDRARGLELLDQLDAHFQKTA